MNRNQAMRLWDGLASLPVGCDSHGEVVEQCTAFGAVALSHGLPQTFHDLMQVVNRQKAAAFLRKWADSLESIESKT